MLRKVKRTIDEEGQSSHAFSVFCKTFLQELHALLTQKEDHASPGWIYIDLYRRRTLEVQQYNAIFMMAVVILIQQYPKVIFVFILFDQ